MKLLSLHCENIFSIGTIDVNLTDNYLTLVTGWSYDENRSNGCGKSSLVRNAVLWGLYGKTLDTTSSNDVINKNTSIKKCLVKISFEGVDGKTYNITRSRPSKLLLTNGENKEISDRKSKDTQETINQLLGRNFSVFTHTTLFGQGRNNPFLELTPAEQQSFIEEIIPIDQIDRWKDSASKNVTTVKELLDSERHELEFVKGKIEATEEGLGTSTSQRNTWSVSQLRRLIDERKTLVQLQESKTIHEDHTEKALKKSMLLIDDYEKNNCTKRLKNFEAKREKIGEDYLQSEKDVSEQESVLAYLHTIVRDKSKETTKIEVDNICPTCDRVFLLKEEANVAFESITKKITKGHEDIVKETFRLNLLQQVRQAQRSAHSDTSAKITNIETIRGEIESSVHILEELQKQNFDETLEKHQELIDNLEKEQNPHAVVVLKLEEGSIKLKKKYTKLKTRCSKLTDDLTHLIFWKEVFSKDFKVFILEQICPFLEDRTNYYLGKLNNSHLKVKFSTERTLISGEKKASITVTIDSKTGAPSYALLSGGERQLVNFAVSLALADLAATQTGGDSKTLVLDEPFENLDKVNCDNVISFIHNELKNIKDNIFIVSNEEHLKELIPNKIFVEKKHGVSSLRP